MTKEKEITKGFGDSYAELYDSFYKDKDYDKEVGMLEDIFKQYGCNKGSNILDIGCGTGNHAIKMAKRGYDVTGIDPSEPMLKIAKRKSLEEGVKIKFIKSGLPNLDLYEKYDGIECMFNVIDYVLEDKKILDSFKKIKEHLKDGGVFVFDFRNAIPSLKDYSKKRILNVDDNQKDIVRVSKSIINPKTRIFNTEYTCLVYKDKKFVEKFKDEHNVRAFFLGEIEDFLFQSGLKLKEMFPFGKQGQKVTNDDWNIIGVCTK